MTNVLEEYDNFQTALDDKAEDLQTATGRLAGALNQYDKDWTTQEEVLEVAEEANNAYDQLDEVEEEILNGEYTFRDAVEDFEQALQEQGYDDLEAYIEGKEPLTASQNPHEQAVAEFTQENIDWSAANQAREQYNEVTSEAREEYGINVPLADSIQNSETSRIIDQLSEGELEPEDIEL